ncbi:hypothetical protein RUM43_014295 [Polyplax serrata]|uniref:Uncharacterized protein n=1 Tax=Polyplax serrata TaxID=468196 RepID=A0AAN8Q299_POLSC
MDNPPNCRWKILNGIYCGHSNREFRFILPSRDGSFKYSRLTVHNEITGEIVIIFLQRNINDRCKRKALREIFCLQWITRFGYDDDNNDKQWLLSHEISAQIEFEKATASWGFLTWDSQPGIQPGKSNYAKKWKREESEDSNT